MVRVPASPSLHRFFEAVGMDECFATRKVEILTSALSGDTGGGVMTPVSPREYNEIREGYLKNTFHMTYTDQMISFQQIGRHLAYGDLYKIEIDGGVGCAAIEYVQKRRLLTKELLIPTDKMGKAVETIAKAQDLGILYGYEDNTIRPKNTLSRAEGVALLMNLVECLEAA